jgi:GT2 family glycosyltransferase
MSQPPLASIVIPSYNHGRFLEQAITSALGQTLQPTEVIVVDDGSTDGTADVAAAYAGRITYLRQENAGLSAARNAGISVAHAPLLQFLDSDDALYPGALEAAWSSAKELPGLAVFLGGWDEMDAGGATMTSVAPPPLPLDTFHGLFDAMLLGPPCRYVVRRSALDLVGGFDVELRACEDWDMWLRMAAAGLGFRSLPHTHARYRNHPASMSKDIALMWMSGLRVLDRASKRHGPCPQCRRSMRLGIATWRDWCYGSMLAPQLQQLAAHHQYASAIGKCTAALARDPALSGCLLRSLRDHLQKSRRAGHGQDRSPMRSRAERGRL